MTMKKIIALLMSLTVIASVTSCSKSPDTDSIAPTTQAQEQEPITLTNKMSANELSRADKHALTLLDEPAEGEHRVELQQKKVPLDEYK